MLIENVNAAVNLSQKASEDLKTEDQNPNKCKSILKMIK